MHIIFWSTKIYPENTRYPTIHITAPHINRAHMQGEEITQNKIKTATTGRTGRLSTSLLWLETHIKSIKTPLCFHKSRNLHSRHHYNHSEIILCFKSWLYVVVSARQAAVKVISTACPPICNSSDARGNRLDNRDLKTVPAMIQFSIYIQLLPYWQRERLH